MQAFQDLPIHTDPTVTLGGKWSKQIGSVGFLVAGVAIRIVAPVVGPLTILAGSVSLVWLSLHKSDPLEHAYKYKRTKDLLCVGALFCIPVVGVLVAGVFAKKRMSHVLDTGVHGGVEALTEIVCYPLKGLIQRAFFPLSRAGLKQVDSQITQSVLCNIDLPNGGVRTVEMILSDKARAQRLPRAIVMFPRRDKTGLSDDAQATEYAEKFDVYRVTLGGYPKKNQADFTVETTESTCIQDANAAIVELRQLGYKKIAVHGSGLGCVPALAAAQLHPDLVRAVVLDRGFTRAKDVLANVVRNLFQRVGLGKFVPTSILRGIAGTAFPPGLPIFGVSDDITTNQMDNLQRIQAIQVPVGCIEATQDVWMSRTILPGTPESFSRDLLRAHQGKNDKDAIQFLKGGHEKALSQGVLVNWVDQVMPIDEDGPEVDEGDYSETKEHKSSVLTPEKTDDEDDVNIELSFTGVSDQSSSSSSAASTVFTSTVSSESSASVSSSPSKSASSLLEQPQKNPWAELPFPSDSEPSPETA